MRTGPPRYWLYLFLRRYWLLLAFEIMLGQHIVLTHYRSEANHALKLAILTVKALIHMARTSLS
jgi:hypothetical protein